jgi:DNA-directed RNA polymerase beta' subunit
MSLYDIKQINALHFGIMSSAEVEKNSVVEVKSAKISSDNMDHTVYDPRMGSMEMNVTCPTCNQNSKECPGHFGHITLSVPVVHPLLYKFVLALLKVFCHKCSRFLLTEDMVKLHGFMKHTRNIRFQKIVKFVEKSNTCIHCLAQQPKMTFSPTETCFLMAHKDTAKDQKLVISADEIYKKFDNVLDSEVELLGFDPTRMHPRNLVIWNLPVLPPIDRPYVVAAEMTCDDDITIQYGEIIKINAHLANPQTPHNKRQKYFQSLKFRIKCLMDNSQNKAKHTNGRPFKGFKKRIAGKEGQVRGNLMGKRVEQAARTVIGPDPTLKFGQIGIPIEVAQTLTVAENINVYNIQKMQELVDRDKVNAVLRGKSRIRMKYATRNPGTKLEIDDQIKRLDQDGVEETINLVQVSFVLKEGDKIFRKGVQIKTILPNKKKFVLQIGDKIERQLMNGDIVLLNRQPTLHKGSMIAHEVVILPGKTFRFNLSITSSFNADFDGDEMNIHVPQDPRARAELRELSHAKKILVSAQSSKANVKIVQDSLLGNFLMTRNSDVSIPREQFWNICAKGSGWNTDFILKKLRHIERVLNRYGNPHELYSGRSLFSMMLPYDFIYKKRNNASSQEPIVEVIEGVLIKGAISKADLGGGHSSMLRLVIKEYPTDVATAFIDNLQFIPNAWLVYRGFSVGIKDCIASEEKEIQAAISKCFIEATMAEKTTSNPLIKEAKINEALSKARDIGMKLAKDALTDDNNFISTVTSGSKGDYFNIAQIAGLLGQQNFSGGRIKPALNKGRRSIPHYNFGKLSQETSYESKGFVKNSFMHGLSPEETWFHAITGREGVTDTSMKTSRTGYIQRKLIKCGEDHQVHYDHSVRAANGSIVQFVYGNDGLDGSETVVLNGKPAICNMSRIIDKYNLTQEKHTRCSNKWKKLSQKLMNIADYSSSSLSEEDISEEDISSNNSSVASSEGGSDSEFSSTSQEESVEEDSEEGGETDLDIEEDDWDDEDDMEEDEDDMEEDDNDI